MLVMMMMLVYDDGDNDDDDDMVSCCGIMWTMHGQICIGKYSKTSEEWNAKFDILLSRLKKINSDNDV